MRSEIFKRKMRSLVLMGVLFIMATSCTSSQNVLPEMNAQAPQSENEEEIHNEEKVDYDVTVEQADHGTIEVSKNKASAGESLKVTFTPDKGYSLKQTKINGVYSDKTYDNSAVCYEEFTQKEGGSTITCTFASNTYKVTLVDRIYGKSFDAITVAYNGNLHLPSTHEGVVGFTLAWYDSDKNLYTDGMTWDKDYDVTLYAKWISDTYTITLDSNGGRLDGKSSVQKYVSFDNSWNFGEPTRKGYVFDGWYYSDSLKVESSGENWLYSSTDIKLTAKWVGETYDVDLDLAGGIGFESLQVSYGDSYSIDEPTKDGFSFRGWYLNDKYIESSGTWTYSTNSVTLVASWQENEFIVSFDLDGGVGVTYDKVSYGLAYSFSRPSKIGYTFAGWYLDGLKIPESGDKWTYSTKNVSLTAKWIAQTNLVSLNLNGGMGVKEYEVEYGEEYSIPEPVKPGYTFCGWYLNDCKIKSEGDEWDFSTKDIVLSAKWVSNEFVIAIDLDDGMGMTEQNVTYDGSYDIGVPSKPGASFAGWYYGDTLVYTEGDCWKYAYSITLKAKWATNMYQATLSLNGGTLDGSTEDQIISVAYNGQYEKRPTRSGFIFEGWYSSSDEMLSITDGSGKFNYPYSYNNVIIAKWKKDSGTLILDANGGTLNEVTKFQKEIGNGTICTITDLGTPKRTGYSFEGWYSASTDGTLMVNSKTTHKWNSTETVTWYAHWTAKNYKIIMHQVVGTSPYYGRWTDSYDIAYGETMSLSNMVNEFYTTPENSTFSGWYTAASGGELRVNSSQSFTWNIDPESGQEDWYPHFTYGQMILTANANGGEFSGGSTSYDLTVEYNDVISLSDLGTPTKEGYTFVGWYSQNGKILYIDASTSYTWTYINGYCMSVYAKWTPLTSTLYLNPNGGTLSGESTTTSMSVEYGTKYDLSSIGTPTREGYTFKGWYTASSGGTVRISSSKQSANEYTWRTTTEQTWYAQWSKKSIKVYLNAYGGEINGLSVDNVDVEYGETYSLSNFGTPTREGYTFAGWYTVKNSEYDKLMCDSDTSFLANITSKQTWYAKWTPNKFTITLDKNQAAFDQFSGGNYVMFYSSNKVTVEYGYKYSYTYSLFDELIIGSDYEDDLHRVALLGWYDSPTGGNLMISPAVNYTCELTSDVTWYAHYGLDGEYDTCVVYDLNGLPLKSNNFYSNSEIFGTYEDGYVFFYHSKDTLSMYTLRNVYFIFTMNGINYTKSYYSSLSVNVIYGLYIEGELYKFYSYSYKLSEIYYSDMSNSTSYAILVPLEVGVGKRKEAMFIMKFSS